MTIYWTSFADFAAMGGYGLYVWGAFGVAALVIVGEMAAVASRRRALRPHAGRAATASAAARQQPLSGPAHES
ncbi:hypothetical protein BH11PSE9_BH11PSE9_15450 [soil metagenome]